MSKWILGVAGSVVAAVIGYYLVSPGGLLNPTHQRPSEARITAFNGPNYSSVGEIPQRTFTVYNGGEQAAEMCNIFWNPFGPDPEVANAIVSEEFTLTPGAEKTISVRADEAYTKAAVFDEGASVFCSASKYHSPVVTRAVNTYGLGG